MYEISEQTNGSFYFDYVWKLKIGNKKLFELSLHCFDLILER